MQLQCLNIEKKYNNMDKVAHMITLALALLSLVVPKTKSEEGNPPETIAQQQPQPLPQRPLCPQQFALANYACSRLPYRPLPPPDDNNPDDPNNPVRAPPSPNAPGDDSPSAPGGEGHHSRHGHRHGHRRRDRRRDDDDDRDDGTPEEDNCCRWAREVDSQCVCEILLRLPPFLVRPMHRYILDVGDVCEIIYSCGGPI